MLCNNSSINLHHFKKKVIIRDLISPKSRSENSGDEQTRYSSQMTDRFHDEQGKELVICPDAAGRQGIAVEISGINNEAGETAHRYEHRYTYGKNRNRPEMKEKKTNKEIRPKWKTSALTSWRLSPKVAISIFEPWSDWQRWRRSNRTILRWSHRTRYVFRISSD